MKSGKGKFCSHACSQVAKTLRSKASFESYFDRGESCWEWKGKIFVSGYGSFRNDLAHRESYRRLVGPIGRGLCVCHKCDNPKCVRPDHLFLGSHAENVADKIGKGRQPSKLGTPQVREIRALFDRKVPTREIASQFNVHASTVLHIGKRETWKFLPE